ncbi:MAG: ATP-binding protein [Thermoanaerobaculum sp.]|nr:ATP-binding protein [Thermoanaerobaculum sp.]MDW7966927.1 ATP-binding protein [Thermoanaerobaculum sp.]
MAVEAKLSLFSAYENIELAEKVLADLARSFMDEEGIYWAAMALREALANAIKHGNKLNPEKRVLVTIHLEEERELRITVEDEGEGFDPSQLADPRSPENLLKEHGRGVFYIRHFMDEVSFGRSATGGSKVELVKRLSRRST